MPITKITTGVLTDDLITSDKVANEFTTVSSLTPGSSSDISFTSAQIFTLTPNQSTTLNVTNPVIGSQKSVIVTGAGSSYTVSLTVGGLTGTFNKISGDYDDTSGKKNLYSILCVGATEFWYSISQIAT